MERFAGGIACQADRASVQRGKEGERWKGVPVPQNADGRAGYRKAARTTAMCVASMGELITLGVECPVQYGCPAGWRALDVRLDRWARFRGRLGSESGSLGFRPTAV